MTTTEREGRVPALELPHRAEGRIFNMVTPLLDRHVEEGRGNRPALLLESEVVTYAGLQKQANRAGNLLARAGVEPENRVALLLPDDGEFVATFLGAMKIGAVPIPLNTLASTKDRAHYLSNSRARVLVTTGQTAHDLLTDPPELPPLLKTIFVVDDDLPDHPRVRSYREAFNQASDNIETFPTGVDEPCYWLYSSGTTGLPKGTVHLHGDMLACVAPYAEEVVGITPDDICFSVAKLFFSYGLVNSLFLPLLAGAAVALSPRRPEPATLLQVLRAHKPTLFFSVPTSYAQLCSTIEKDGAAKDALQSVRLAISAGEPLPAPLYRRWKDLTGIEVLDGIGSTEVGYIYCSNLPGNVREGSSGVMLGDHEGRIVDELGQDCPSDEPGELWVRADSTALHYWNQRERTKAAFVGEWLRTGDRYTRDSDGFYWYLGRANDVFKVSGQWVSPLEVESCLLTYPGVQECAVVAADDSAGLVKPKAFVVLAAGAQVTEQDLQAHVKAHLQPHKYPRWVVFVDELPKTASGKVQRYRLRELSN